MENILRSYKWVSESSAGKQQLEVSDVTAHVFSAISGSRFSKAQNANLVSIFGRAREGKSFLMNCLADQDGLFRISNGAAPCTEGIDISSKWMDVRDFSAVDGGEEVKGKIKVGFVDAEGQGDKTVEHDAKISCPVLLLSQCVLFNWKGGLLKDEILSKLGVMARSAANIAREAFDNAGEPKSPVSDSSGPPNRTKPFAHLHIVFRDWTSEDVDSTAVHRTLFDPEGTSASGDEGREVRDQIRDQILSSFTSVRVWLLPPPNENGKVLRREMTKDDMSEEFRSGVRELRRALSSQLSVPKLFAGMPLTGKSLKMLMERVILTINQGSVVVPSGIYKSMLALELSSAFKGMEADMRGQITELLGDLNRTSLEGPFSESYPDVEEVAVEKCSNLLLAIVAKHEAEIRESICDESSVFGKQLLESEEHMQSISVAKAHLIEFFTVSYRDIFSRWLLRASSAAHLAAAEQLEAIRTSIDVGSKDTPVVEEEVESVLNHMKAMIGLDTYGLSHALVKASIDGMVTFIEVQKQHVLAYNKKKMQDEEEALRAFVEAEAEAEKLKKARVAQPEVVGGGSCCSGQPC